MYLLFYLIFILLIKKSFQKMMPGVNYVILFNNPVTLTPIDAFIFINFNFLRITFGNY